MAGERILTEVERALGARIERAEAIAEGWTAQHGSAASVRRCTVSGGLSVIVKSGRSKEALARERAALELLAGSGLAPRLLAHGDGFSVLEDLGAGAAVEDLLVGNDAAAASDALVLLARALGSMAAATVGQADAFYARLPQVDARADRQLGVGLLRDTAGLPDSRQAEADVADLQSRLADPGPFLALSNGDVAPQNSRVTPGGVRLLDFDRAAFRHALLDAAQLRFPFCAAPCWARLPAEVTAAMERAFRDELGRVCPAVLDERLYAHEMAAALAAWALLRLERLPKLLAADEPHPMGFSRRGQLLNTVQTAIDGGASLPALRDHLERTVFALRRLWPELPPAQAVYPAFR